MSRKKRLTLFLLIIVLQGLYFPLNRTIQSGYLLKLPWDEFIPFWPVWFVPYLLSLVWWNGSYLWAALSMEAELLKTFALSIVLVLLSSYLVFIVFPTYAERPIITEQGWQFELAKAVYSNDRVNNAFPSGHTYNSVLIALFWWRWLPKLRWVWASLATIVVISTLFTGQHHLVDPIGGIFWAWSGYKISFYVMERKRARIES